MEINKRNVFALCFKQKFLTSLCIQCNSSTANNKKQTNNIYKEKKNAYRTPSNLVACAQRWITVPTDSLVEWMKVKNYSYSHPKWNEKIRAATTMHLQQMPIGLIYMQLFGHCLCIKRHPLCERNLFEKLWLIVIINSYPYVWASICSPCIWIPFFIAVVHAAHSTKFNLQLFLFFSSSLADCDMCVTLIDIIRLD